MTFDFQLSEKDFIDAQRSHLRKRYAKAGVVSVVGFACFVLLGIVGGVLWLIDRNSQAAKQMAPMTIVVMIVCLLIVWIWSGLPYRQQFRKIRALQLPMQISVTDSEISYTSPNGQSRSLWAAIEAWRESKNIFMFYTQPNLFYVLPKRVMNADEITAFRELLLSKVGKS